MTDIEVFELAVAAACVLVAALLVTAEAALQSFSKSRAQRLLDEGRGGAQALVNITQDPAPTLNTLLFVRILAEIVAIVRRTGALEATRSAARAEAQVARERLQLLPDSSAREALLELCARAVERSF